MNNTLGENVARYRKQIGLTQEELAEKMNVSGQAVSKWENGLSYPEKVDRRTLTIRVKGGEASKVCVRIPVLLLKRAAENGKLKDLLGEQGDVVDQVMPMILEGAVGELVNVEQGDATVVIAVEDHEG